jgi:ABC-2 type transport system permease protein
MTFVGGCWWRNEMASELINAIGRFTPVYWLMDSIGKLIENRSLASASFGIFMVILFSTAFFLFGTWKKGDMAI